MAQHGHSEACCNVPPAIVKDYKEKGKFVEIGGLNTYATGPSSATTAIFIIFDVFGFRAQVLQGADILAYADDEQHQHQVYVPDFFYGKPAELDWYPPDTPEKGEKLGAFFQGPASPTKTADKVPQLIEAIKKYSPSIEKFGVLGMCWGGKIVSLTSGSGTVFSVAAEVHPAMVEPNDGKGISIPICMLPSGDENQEDIKGFQEALTVPNYIETFADQVHGWMAARADLEKENVKKAYERGYSVVLGFFHKYL